MGAELWVDNGGAHADEAWILGLPHAINITNSSARAQHGAFFEQHGKKFTYEYTGDIARAGYNLDADGNPK